MSFKDLWERKGRKGKDNKKSRDKSINDLSERMLEISNHLMREQIITPVTIRFIKMSMEINLFIFKNELDEDIFLQDKLEDYSKFMQKSGEDIRGKDAIIFYEKIPILLEELRLALKVKEKNYEEMKLSADELFKVFDKIEEETN